VTGISQSPDYFDASVDLDLTQLLDQEDKNDGVTLEVKPKKHSINNSDCEEVFFYRKEAQVFTLVIQTTSLRI